MDDTLKEREVIIIDGDKDCINRILYLIGKVWPIIAKQITMYEDVDVPGISMRCRLLREEPDEYGMEIKRFSKGFGYKFLAGKNDNELITSLSLYLKHFFTDTRFNKYFQEETPNNGQ